MPFDIEYGSYEVLEKFFKKKNRYIPNDKDYHTFLTEFNNLPDLVQNFMISSMEQVTGYNLNSENFLINSSALSFMFFSILAIPLNKKCIYLPSPCYPRIYQFCKMLSIQYPKNFQIVDDPSKANIEVIILPNNPDGKIYPLKTLKQESYVIIDYVYCYPHFFHNNKDFQKCLDHSKKIIGKMNKYKKPYVLIKNLTQLVGVPSYRLSWAYVSDLVFKNIIYNYVFVNNGVSKFSVEIFDKQLQHINFDTLFKNYYKITKKRVAILKKCLKNIKYKSLIPFITIKDKDLKLYNHLLKNGIKVMTGDKMNTSKEILRIPVFMEDKIFKELVETIKDYS